MKNLLLLFVVFIVGCSSRGELFSQTAADVDYIILASGVDGLNNVNSANVAFYINIPDSNNFAGVNFRLIAQRVRGDTSQVSWLTGALFDSLAIGARLEEIRTVRFDAGLTKAQKRTHIDDVFTNNLPDFLAKWYARHDFYGLERVL